MTIKYTQKDLKDTLKEITTLYNKAETIADYLGESFSNPLDVYGMGGWYTPKPITYTELLERIADGRVDGEKNWIKDLIREYNELPEDDQKDTYFSLENWELTTEPDDDNYDGNYGWRSSSSSC